MTTTTPSNTETFSQRDLDAITAYETATSGIMDSLLEEAVDRDHLLSALWGGTDVEFRAGQLVDVPNHERQWHGLPAADAEIRMWLALVTDWQTHLDTLHDALAGSGSRRISDNALAYLREEIQNLADATTRVQRTALAWAFGTAGPDFRVDGSLRLDMAVVGNYRVGTHGLVDMGRCTTNPNGVPA